MLAFASLCKQVNFPVFFFQVNEARNLVLSWQGVR